MWVPNQMVWLTCVVFIGCIGLSHQQKGSLELGVEVGRVHTTSATSPATVLCTLRDGKGKRVPIAGCEFHHGDTIWHLNQGPASTTWHHHFHEVIVRDVYFGTGLENGDCGLTLTHITASDSTHQMRCRVRPAAGGAWIYSLVMLIVSDRSPTGYHLQPSGVAVHLPGSDVTFLGSADRQIDRCYFWLHSILIDLPTGASIIDLSSEATSETVNNYRAWSESKQCGLTMRAIQSSWSGLVESTMHGESPSSMSTATTVLIVAAPPKSQPILTVEPTKAHFQPGDVLNATCVVGASLPVSNLTWYLGGKIIRRDNWNEAPAESEWTDGIKPQGIEQRLSRQLTLQDDGKTLKCRAEHLALPSLNLYSNTFKIRVKVGAAPSQPSRPQVVSEDNFGDGIPVSANRLLSETKQTSQAIGCGRREVEPALISGGRDAYRGEFPWNAGIFKVVGDSDFKHICGGTLIRPDIVISAAHCFVDQNYQKLVSNTSVKVALGKVRLDWYEDMHDSEVQRFDVASISIPDDYRGASDDYRLDIAVVKLATSASMTKYVNVACVHWGQLSSTRNRDQLKTGDIGTAAGWGKTKTSTTSHPDLQRIDLPWVDKDTCRNGTQLEMRRYLTRDKFCAGYKDQRKSVCQGDSGAGLVFVNSRNRRHYLRGIVSTSLGYNLQPALCSSDHYVTFTSVGEHVDWIKENLVT